MQLLVEVKRDPNSLKGKLMTVFPNVLGYKDGKHVIVVPML